MGGQYSFIKSLTASNVRKKILNKNNLPDQAQNVRLNVYIGIQMLACN